MGFISIKIKWHLLGCLMVFIPWSSWASGVRFSGGEILEATPISGHLEISCWEKGQRDFKFARCQNVLLLPYEFDYLVTDRSIEADKVTLKAYHEDGSSEKKSGQYLPGKKRSRSHFNLWIDTLLQDPLLEFGKNRVDYRFTRKGRGVESGSFQVDIVKGKTRACPRARYDSNRLEDCRNEYRACQEYYEYFNYCED